MKAKVVSISAILAAASVTSAIKLSEKPAETQNEVPFLKQISIASVLTETKGGGGGGGRECFSVRRNYKLTKISHS